MHSWTHDNQTADLVTDSAFPLLMPRWGYVAAAFVLFVIGFLGFFLNLLVIVLMLKDRQLWTPLNVILFNLVCSDFSVSILGNPFTLVSSLFHGWIFGESMCVLYGFFMALLGIASITTLTVLSFERYLMVSRPLLAHNLTYRGAACAVACIWGYALALTTPPLFGWGNYVSEGANISCSVNWQEQTFNTLTYILFLFAMGQIIPMTVITFSYGNIIRTMKQNTMRMSRVSRAEARVTTMVFIMILAFTAAWTPYSILALIEQFASERKISPGVGVIPALVAKSSICYNPLIYVGMNSQFQSSIMKFFDIRNKSEPSNTDRGVTNTLISPAKGLSNYTVAEIKSNTKEQYITRSDKKQNNVSSKPNKQLTALHDEENIATNNKKTPVETKNADTSFSLAEVSEQTEDVMNIYNSGEHKPELYNDSNEEIIHLQELWVNDGRLNVSKNAEYNNLTFELSDQQSLMNLTGETKNRILVKAAKDFVPKIKLSSSENFDSQRLNSKKRFSFGDNLEFVLRNQNSQGEVVAKLVQSKIEKCSGFDNV